MALLRRLPAKRWLALIDLALLITAALMALTDETVLLFHLIFVWLTLGAFFWEFRAAARSSRSSCRIRRWR